MTSILQDWVNALGLRYQGVLLSVVRGCDTSPKEDASKALARAFRSEILNAHVGDPKKSKSFIEWVDLATLKQRCEAFGRNHDNLPMHYVMHMAHAAQIVGYFHPDPNRRLAWRFFYEFMCSRLHLNPESLEQLRERLEADEDAFGEQQEQGLGPAR